MSIDGSVTANFTINNRQIVGLSSTTTTNLPIASNPSNTFSNGSGASQGTQVYGKLRTFSGTTDTINLTSLADLFGDAIDFATIKGILVQNLSTANNIVVGDAGSNPWSTFLNSTGTITLPPGAWFVASTPDATGWVVTPSTAINLLVTGTSGQSYAIALVG